jgi:protein SCO1/2
LLISFTNQNGKTITQKDYEGKIYVADFSSQRVVLFVQNDNQSIRSKKAFANNPKVKLLSLLFFQRLIVFVLGLRQKKIKMMPNGI